MKNFKPQVRGGFSDRNGINVISNTLQLDDFNQVTRNCIMNVVDIVFKEVEKESFNAIEFLYKRIYYDIFRSSNDDIPYYSHYNYGFLREPISKGITKEWTYDEILTFLEKLVSWNKQRLFSGAKLPDLLNAIFKVECVGYRFIDGIATRVINEYDVENVSKALNTKYEACSKSIKKALEKLYDREKPDYENSVKESISAIEGICNIINGTRNQTLGDALKSLENNGIVIHNAMKVAFEKLYGYTSDKNGIRHNGGVDEKTTFEEAQYMLLTCSAFLNYLISLYEKTIK